MNDIAWFNQPWNKIKEKGADTLDDGELLAVIFNTGAMGQNAVAYANMILSKINIHEFNRYSLHELNRITGSKPKSYQMLALAELFKRHHKLKHKGHTRFINSPADVFNIYKSEMQDKRQEHLFAVYLDSKNKIIEKRLIYIGTLNQVNIHPREIFKHAVKSSANSIVLLHNHPSGDPTPSQEDKMITVKLKEIGEMMGIKVLDHIVIGDDSFLSI